MNILLGVTGGIAAYKSAEFVSLAVKQSHMVRVVMTENAARFVGPVTFEGLCGHPVLVGQDHLANGQAMAHIEWARWAERVVVAPATANAIAKMAIGLADDALSTILLATRAPVVIAPAMNTAMWEHPTVQRNLGWLSERDNVTVMEPIAKRLACGEEGPGALPDPAAILQAVTL